MVVFHFIVVVCSLILLIFLSTMESRMPRHHTPSYGLTIFMALLAVLYSLVGIVTFWRARYSWGRVLAIFSVVTLLFYFFALLALHYLSVICGIDQVKNETLIVTFNESRIQNCDWHATTCLLSFPDNIMERCSTLPSFWDHVATLHNENTRFLVITRLVDGGLVYCIFVLFVLFLSLVLAMLLGVQEQVVVRPDSRRRRSNVPLNTIV